LLVTRKETAILLLVGILAGAALKCSMLFHMGVFDMDTYYDWGKGALTKGLPNYYVGFYYPFQLQVFEVCVWITVKLGIPFFTTFKLANILFDIGSFVLLIALLNRRKANPAYALFYWLHPWFLAVFSLGFVDFQFTFFVLLCIWLLRRESTRDYLLAGVPLAAAFLMKPQAQILVIAAFFYALFHYLRRRDPRPFGLLAAPALFFLVYETWFIISCPPPRYVAALILPRSYLILPDTKPLTAQMPNMWSPIAYLIKKSGEPIRAVEDQIHVLPYIPAKYLAPFFTLSLIGLHIWRVEQEQETSLTGKFAKIFLFAALVVPLFMTSAHENHLFLATALLVLFIADHVTWSTTLAAQILLLVQFLNIYSLYGEHPSWLAQFFRPARSDEWEVVYAVISLASFWFIAKPLWSRVNSPSAIT
jgi:hypothetical protein